MNRDNPNQNNHTPPKPEGERHKLVARRTAKDLRDMPKRDNLAMKTTRATAGILGKIVSLVLNVVLTLLLVGIITGGIVGGAFAIYIRNYIDPNIDIGNPETDSNLTTRVYYMEYTDYENRIGEPVEMPSEQLHSSENRTWVKYDEMPTNLIYAFISIEDHRFFDHKGVDWYRTLGAVKNFFMPTKATFGGSTITQQLIKTITQEDEYRPQRKIQEILRALNLEKKLSKSEILEYYLNSIFLGQGAYGVEAAANTYFGKSVSELTLVECASLASIAKAPFTYNPATRPEQNKTRRHAVLLAMLEYGKITEEEYREADAQELTIQRKESQGDTVIRSWYTDAAFNDIRDDLMKLKGWDKTVTEHYIYSAGLSIVLAVDPKIQQPLEYVYASQKGYFPEIAADEMPLQSAFVIMDPRTGDILGLVGGRGAKDRNRGFNRATQAFRQCGSSIKPLSVYGQMIDSGLLTYGSIIDDYPFQWNEKNGTLTGYPRNEPNRYYGYVPVSFAVEKSLNTVPMKLMKTLTPQSSFNFLKNTLHMNSLVDAEKNPNGTVLTDIDYAPLVLGGMTHGVTVRELTEAYTPFANKGIYTKGRTYLYVKDKDGNIVLDNRNEQHTLAFSEETASIMTRLLKRVTETGTAARLEMKNKIDVAGKTGTTNDDKDRWFVGYTPYYVATIWLGYDEPQYLGKFNPSPTITVWNIIMDHIHDKVKGYYNNPKKFEYSSDIIEVAFCKDSGMLPTDACRLDPRGSRIEMGYFKAGTEPSSPCNVHQVVNWCTVTGAVAGPGCPAEKVKRIALVKNITRNMPKQEAIVDAQYTWRPVPAGYVYPSNIMLPFYANLMPAGTFSGVSDDKRPVNSFCVEHNRDLTLPVSQRPTEGTTEPATEAVVTPPPSPETQPVDTSEKATEKDPEKESEKKPGKKDKTKNDKNETKPENSPAPPPEEEYTIEHE